MLRFLCRYAVWLVSAYMIGGIVFLVLIESVFNGGFDFSMKILWLPLLLLIFGFTWVNRHLLGDAYKSVFMPWLLAVLAYPLMILFSWPYVMALNAATASGDMIVYRGPVVRRRIDHGTRGGDSCRIDLRDVHSTEIITITVPLGRYASLSVGDIATEEFRRGGFGIPFRWRFAKLYP